MYERVKALEERVARHEERIADLSAAMDVARADIQHTRDLLESGFGRTEAHLHQQDEWLQLIVGKVTDGITAKRSAVIGAVASGVALLCMYLALHYIFHVG